MKPLTARQRQTLRLAAAGHSNAQIAAALGITAHTVSSILFAAYRRLGANDRAHAVVLAIYRGEITHVDLARIADQASKAAAA